MIFVQGFHKLPVNDGRGGDNARLQIAGGLAVVLGYNSPGFLQNNHSRRQVPGFERLVVEKVEPPDRHIDQTQHARTENPHAADTRAEKGGLA